MLEAIYWLGIHAVGVYEFAEGIGEFVHGTANPSPTFGGPPPFDKGGFAQKPSSPTILTYTIIFVRKYHNYSLFISEAASLFIIH